MSNTKELVDFIIGESLGSKALGQVSKLAYLTGSLGELFTRVLKPVKENMGLLQSAARNESNIGTGHVVEKIFSKAGDEDNIGVSFHPKTIEHFNSCAYCKAQAVNLGLSLGEKEILKYFGGDLDITGVISGFKKSVNREKLLATLDKKIQSTVRKLNEVRTSKNNFGFDKKFANLFHTNVKYSEYELRKLQSLRQAIGLKSESELVNIGLNTLNDLNKKFEENKQQCLMTAFELKFKLPSLIKAIKTNSLSYEVSNLRKIQDTVKRLVSSSEKTLGQVNIEALKEIISGSPTIKESLSSSPNPFKELANLFKSPEKPFCTFFPELSPTDKVIFSNEKDLNKDEFFIIATSQKNENENIVLKFYATPPLPGRGVLLTVNIKPDGKIINYINHEELRELDNPLDEKDKESLSIGETINKLIGVINLNPEALAPEELKVALDFINGTFNSPNKKVAQVLSLFRDNNIVDEIYKALNFPLIPQEEINELKENLEKKQKKDIFKELLKETKNEEIKTRRNLSNVKDGIIVCNDGFSATTYTENSSRFIKSPEIENGIVVTLYNPKNKTGALLHFSNDVNIKNNLSLMIKALNDKKEDLEVRIFSSHLHEQRKSLSLQVTSELYKLGLNKSNFKEITTPYFIKPDKFKKTESDIFNFNSLGNMPAKVSHIYLDLLTGKIWNGVEAKKASSIKPRKLSVLKLTK